MDNGITIISVLIGVGAILIPLVMGMIRCARFLIEGEGKVSTLSAYSANYEGILDVTEDIKVKPFQIRKREYAEILSIGIAPIMGILVSVFLGDMKIPFDPAFALSANAFILVGYTSYWLSRIFRQQLPTWVHLLLPYGILIGVVCYIFLFIHFLSALTALAMFVVSFIAFPLIAPLPACLYAMRQFKVQVGHNRTLVKNDEATGSLSSFLMGWKVWIINIFFLIVIVFAIQITLALFGQPLDAFWLAFRGSDGFFFSVHSSIF